MSDKDEALSARSRDGDGGPPFRAPPAVGPIELGGSLSLSLELDLRLPRFCDLAFDATLVGEGWYGCERAGDVAFRWMGVDESASITLAVDRSVDLAATLAIYNIRSPGVGEALRIAVDEPSRVVPHEQTKDSVSFVLPRRSHSGDGTGDQNAPTRVFILAGPGLLAPPDPRTLSVACRGLRIRPLHDAQADGQGRRVTLVATLSRYFESLAEAVPVRRHAPASALPHDRA